jgi:Na+/H+-dicarboxylate symporter
LHCWSLFSRDIHQKVRRKGKLFQNFILSGNEVMKQLLLLIMKVAPIGLGAYFAYQVGTIGPQLSDFTPNL